MKIFILKISTENGRLTLAAIGKHSADIIAGTAHAIGPATISITPWVAK